MEKLSRTQQHIVARMREGIPLRYVHRRGERYAWLNEPPTFWGGSRVRLPTFLALKRKGVIVASYHDRERTMFTALQPPEVEE